MATEQLVIFRGKEIDCIRQLAKWFESGKVVSNKPEEFATELGVDLKAYELLMKTMREHGFIDVTPDVRGHTVIFTIRAAAVQAARQIEAHEKMGEDVVDRMYKSARQHPIVAWAIILFLCLTALLTFVNQIIQLVKNLRS